MALLLVLAALAQSPADRVAIESLRDSLALVTDSVALARVEATTIELAKQHRDDPLVHVRLGFIADRLGDLTKNKSHYDDAAGEFEWAGELRPEWPYPWYGLGLSELAVGENSVMAIENIRQMLGKDYLSKAAKAFARPTVADPSFASAVVDLANTALTQRIRPRLDVALNAVRLAAASTPGRHPEVQLVRGRAEREAGEAGAALSACQADRGGHGEPDRRARLLCREPEEPHGEGCATNESWLYRRREGDLVCHFVARGDVQDYKLVESLADVLGFRRAVRASIALDPEVPALYQ